MYNYKVKAKVTGKWIKGIIFKRAQLSLYLEEMQPRYYDLPVTMAFWNAVDIGTEIYVTFEEHEDGLWYPIEWG